MVSSKFIALPVTFFLSVLQAAPLTFCSHVLFFSFTLFRQSSPESARTSVTTSSTLTSTYAASPSVSSTASMSLRSSSLSSRPSYPTSSIATPLFAATPLLSCPSTSFLRESSCSTVHRRSSTNSSPPNRILLVSETRLRLRILLSSNSLPFW